VFAAVFTRSFNARFGGTVIAKTLQVLPPDGVIDLMLDEPGTLSMEGERRVGGSLLAYVADGDARIEHHGRPR
jgi:hypothetical protein